MKKLTSLLLVLAMVLPVLSACGSEPATSTETTAPDTTVAEETTAAVTEPEYTVPDLSLDGRTLTIITTPKTLWNLNTELDIEEQTGDALDDAIYARNRDIESRHNFKMKVIYNKGYHSGELLNEAIRKDVTSGDGQYDAAYAQGGAVGSLISDGALYNLYDFDELQLSKPWWLQETIESATIGDEEFLYFAQSHFALTAFDLTWCLFFNENMMNDLGLAMPYDLVREGKWTFDKLREYTKAAASLNGDESFTWTNDGNSVYGLSAQKSVPTAHIIAAGGIFCDKDSAGKPVFALNTERMTSIYDKLASFYGTAGEFYLGNTNTFNESNPGNHMGAFVVRRALFFSGEVKASLEMRNFEDTFGVLPHPKFDENQEAYYSLTNYNSPVLTIPVTSKYANDTAALLDELSYMSYKDVLPVYYDVTVSQKGLRNDNSIEMLDIISNSISFCADLCYGWTLTTVNAVSAELISGNGSVASVIEANKESANASIAKMMESFIK